MYRVHMDESANHRSTSYRSGDGGSMLCAQSFQGRVAGEAEAVSVSGPSFP